MQQGVFSSSIEQQGVFSSSIEQQGVPSSSVQQRVPSSSSVVLPAAETSRKEGPRKSLINHIYFISCPGVTIGAASPYDLLPFCFTVIVLWLFLYLLTILPYLPLTPTDRWYPCLGGVFPCEPIAPGRKPSVMVKVCADRSPRQAGVHQRAQHHRAGGIGRPNY